MTGRLRRLGCHADCFSCSGGDAHRRGDLGIRQVHEEAQDECFALAFGQPAQRR
jgi:hypothetical protein